MCTGTMGDICSKMNGSYPNDFNNVVNPPVRYIPNELDLIEYLLNHQRNDDGLIDHLLGCAYGQALGDAYGLSTEFETRRKIDKTYPDTSKVIPFPVNILNQHSQRWAPCDWTDDTDQWILILETLIENNGDERVFAKKLKYWIEHGFPELNDYAGMGLGAHVGKVVYTNGYLDDPLHVSKSVWIDGKCQSAPNGAVMRCSACAFVHFNDLEKLKSTTISMCKTTHFDPRCIASCLAICLTVAHLIQKKLNENDIEPLIEHVQNETLRILGENLSIEYRQSFLWYTDRERNLDDLKLDEPNSIGYTYKCLASGFYGLRSTESFATTLNDLIRHGGDADTNGAVCGTMYGARHGYQALPSQWLNKMPYKKWFDKKIIKCLSRMNVIDYPLTNTSL